MNLPMPGRLAAATSQATLAPRSSRLQHHPARSGRARCGTTKPFSAGIVAANGRYWTQGGRHTGPKCASHCSDKRAEGCGAVRTGSLQASPDADLNDCLTRAPRALSQELRKSNHRKASVFISVLFVLGGASFPELVVCSRSSAEQSPKAAGLSQPQTKKTATAARSNKNRMRTARARHKKHMQIARSAHPQSITPQLL